ncbi:MAG: response regulator [Acidobacteriota bacterium]
MVSRILLADDSITIQKVVNLTFADEGIDVVSVSNGEMAARRLDEVNPDLVLADIFMPGKNGYELCEVIKKNAKFRNVPVVLLVGAFEPFDQAEARRVQADAHLTKPFESRTLVETVRKLLAKSERPRTGPPVTTAPAEPETPIVAATPNDWLEPTPVESTVSIDFESSSGEWEPVELPGGPVTQTNGETMPLDLGQAPLGESLSFHPVDLQPSNDKGNSGDVPSWERPTGELVSPPGQSQSSTPLTPEVHASAGEALDSSFEIASASNAGTAEQPSLEIETQTWPDPSLGVPATSSDEPLEASGLAIEAQPWTEDAPSPAAFEQRQMVVDFDESLPANSELDSGAVVHDSIPPGVRLDGRQAQDAIEWRMEEVEQAASELKAEDSRNLKTTMLEPPEGSPVSVEASGETAAAFRFSEAPAAVEASSLFTADEPLGDVLSDGAGELPRTPAAPEAPLDEPTLTEFNLELLPDAPAMIVEVPEPHPTSGRITGELVTADLPLEAQQLVEAASQDFAAKEVVEPFRDVPEQALQPDMLSEASQESLSPEASIDDSAAYDWTSPSAVSHSTGRLDSMVMPVEFAEVPAEDAAPEPDPLEAAVVADTAVELGERESEQLHFAAIDVEASPVEARESSAEYLDPSDPERGFEFSRALVDNLAAATNENGHGETRDTPPGPVELSPLVIDEIVRRVVAQIGDSVVREIAWEIVPDCVERIIEQQTRAALAKR